MTRPEHNWIAHQYLRLPIGDFANMDTWLPRIKIAAGTIISAWKSKYDSKNPILDLRLVISQEGPPGGQTADLRVSNFSDTIRCGDLIWIAGQPGIGKTHSLISIADSLSSSNRLVPVLISLRHWGLQNRDLLKHVAAEPAMRQQGISDQTLATALKAGHLTLLLNGWNEVPAELRQRATLELESLLGQSVGASVIGTSRLSPSSNYRVRPEIFGLTS